MQCTKLTLINLQDIIHSTEWGLLSEDNNRRNVIYLFTWPGWAGLCWWQWMFVLTVGCLVSPGLHIISVHRTLSVCWQCNVNIILLSEFGRLLFEILFHTEITNFFIRLRPSLIWHYFVVIWASDISHASKSEPSEAQNGKNSFQTSGMNEAAMSEWVIWKLTTAVLLKLKLRETYSMSHLHHKSAVLYCGLFNYIIDYPFEEYISVQFKSP